MSFDYRVRCIKPCQINKHEARPGCKLLQIIFCMLNLPMIIIMNLIFIVYVYLVLAYYRNLGHNVSLNIDLRLEVLGSKSTIVVIINYNLL